MSKRFFPLSHCLVDYYKCTKSPHNYFYRLFKKLKGSPLFSGKINSSNVSSISRRNIKKLEFATNKKILMAKADETHRS